MFLCWRTQRLCKRSAKQCFDELAEPALASPTAGSVKCCPYFSFRTGGSELGDTLRASLGVGRLVSVLLLFRALVRVDFIFQGVLRRACCAVLCCCEFRVCLFPCFPCGRQSHESRAACVSAISEPDANGRGDVSSTLSWSN